MEWAIGKGYDFYRPDTSKCCCPVQRSRGICTFMRSAKKRSPTSLAW